MGRRIGDPLRLPTQRVRRAMVVLVVLALAAAGSGVVALQAPSVLADLGVPGFRSAADAAQSGLPVPVPVLVGLPATAPVPTGPGLAAQLDPLARAAALGESAGVVVDPAAPPGSAPLWQLSPNDPLVPGSTGKLLTAAAALLTLDSTDRLVTKVVSGDRPGTVVLVGGGDPTLTALPEGRVGTYPSPARLDDLVAKVRAASPGQKIDAVVVDTSAWSGPVLGPGWDPADVAGGFIAPMVPLMLDGARADPAAQDGARVSDPATAAGRAFAAKLGLPPSAVSEGVAPPGATVLGQVVSAPLGTLIEHMLTTSDNVLAEALARQVAITRKGEPSFAGATAQVLAALAQAGIDVSGAQLVDGSGLSAQDRVPPRLLGAILGAAAAPSDTTEFLRPIVTGLPVAGGDGTLDDRFAGGAAAAGRGAVRAKTGTLTGVSSLAGVVTTADGRLLVFAVMSNGQSPATVRPRLDEFAATLSRCGCR